MLFLHKFPDAVQFLFNYDFQAIYHTIKVMVFYNPTIDKSS